MLSQYYDNPSLELEPHTLGWLKMTLKDITEMNSSTWEAILALPQDARERVLGVYNEFLTAHYTSVPLRQRVQFAAAALETALIWEVG